MHCFASGNQIYKGTAIFGVESLKSLRLQKNLLLKTLQLKTRVENVRSFSWRKCLVGKYGIQSTNENVRQQIELDRSKRRSIRIVVEGKKPDRHNLVLTKSMFC